MSSTTGKKTTRKFPPPCWTRDEALILIETYRERWHALHRAFLRTPDWDAVAEKLTTTFPDVTPPKTSAQCRHKMEKLRQRHRAEKQRAAAFSGDRFLSTWFYYDAMETMETEPGGPDSNPDHQIRVKSLTQIFPPNSTRNRTKPNPRVSNRYSSYPIKIPNQNHDRCSIGDRMKAKPVVTGVNESGRFGLRPRKLRENSVAKRRNKKKSGGIEEVVMSIRLLGEGFMKAEEMKMEVFREIEEMRMETEMKRNRLMLESQKMIVEAFVEGLMKVTTMADV